MIQLKEKDNKTNIACKQFITHCRGYLNISYLKYPLLFNFFNNKVSTLTFKFFSFSTLIYPL